MKKLAITTTTVLAFGLAASFAARAEHIQAYAHRL